MLVVSACAPPPSTEEQRDDGNGAAAAEKRNERAAPAAGAETPQGEERAEAPPLDRENNVYFALASTLIDDAGRQVIRRHAARLKADPRLTVTLSGYTDHLGSREYNVALAQQRVAAVALELRAQRVSARQIRKRSYGYEKALARPCNGEPCRQSLRRVELRYSN